MPTKAYYDLATDESGDIKIPAYPDEAFQQGIRFCAKYIGTQDVSRPSSRVEIVASMRHIRYEYKAKGVKKRNVVLGIAASGIEVYYQKRRRKAPIVDENCVLLMKHPTYRIFYVSHDSQDLKIFSYIARDSGSNVFRCSVFKAHKNNEAVLIVRTIGQSFEVCHKMNEENKDGDGEQEERSDKVALSGDNNNNENSNNNNASANERVPNSESLQSTASSVTIDRSTETGSLMRKSQSIGSAPEPSGVSSSSTATNGFMQNSIYSSGSVPNAFAALLSQSVNSSCIAGGPSARTDACGRNDAPANVDSAIKTAQELLNYATIVQRRPNNVNTPGSASVTTSFHEGVSLTRSPSFLPADAGLNGVSSNCTIPISSCGSAVTSIAPNGSAASAPSATYNNCNINSVSIQADWQQIDRFHTEINSTNMLSAIVEAKQRLLEEQLVQETSLRIETQTRVQQLLVINKQLTQHIYRLSERVQQLQVEITRLQPSSTNTKSLLSDQSLKSLKNGGQTSGSTQSSIWDNGVEIPRLDPPPPSMNRQLRYSTSNPRSRESIASASDRSSVKSAFGDHVQSQSQSACKSLDVNVIAKRLPLAPQIGTKVNGDKKDQQFMSMTSSLFGSDEENKNRMIQSLHT